MRMSDILEEGDIIIPGSGNHITIVMGKDDKSEINNPGIRYNDDGKAKWSPPLQQHLDVVKDAVGPTDDDTTNEIEADADQGHVDELDVLRKLAAITPRPSFPG
jgi:hypothetical protein